jgi:hypothetical protein
MCLRSTSGAKKVWSLYTCQRDGCSYAAAGPWSVGRNVARVGGVRTRNKYTVAPKYFWCRMIVCVLGQYLAHKKVQSLYTFQRDGCSYAAAGPWSVGRNVARGPGRSK